MEPTLIIFLTKSLSRIHLFGVSTGHVVSLRLLRVYEKWQNFSAQVVGAEPAHKSAQRVTYETVNQVDQNVDGLSAEPFPVTYLQLPSS